MTASRDPERLIRAFLDEGPTDLPDRTYDAVRSHIDRTRQRVVIGPWREPRMSNLARIAIAAAAVLVVAVVGYNFLPGGNGPGATGPSPSPSPTATALPTATPQPTGPVALTDGPMPAGRYVAHPFGPANDSISISLTVPDGWEAFQGVGLLPTTGASGPTGMGIGFGLVDYLYSDPCHGHAVADVAVGPTVDDLVMAFQAQSAYETSTPVDVTLGGYMGKRLDLQLPSDLDLSTCDNGEFYFWEGGVYAQGPENRWHLWILDVEGQRIVILAQDFAATSAQDQAELQAIVDSIEIEP
jgi:hypothetical protein